MVHILSVVFVDVLTLYVHNVFNKLRTIVHQALLSK